MYISLLDAKGQGAGGGTGRERQIVVRPGNSDGPPKSLDSINFYSTSFVTKTAKQYTFSIVLNRTIATSTKSIKN